MITYKFILTAIISDDGLSFIRANPSSGAVVAYAQWIVILVF